MLNRGLERASVFSLALSLTIAVPLGAGPIQPGNPVLDPFEGIGIPPAVSEVGRSAFPACEASFLGLVGDGPWLSLVEPWPEPLTELESGELVRGPRFVIAAPGSGVRVSLPAGLTDVGYELLAYGDTPDSYTIALAPPKAAVGGGRFVGFATEAPLAQLQLILATGISPRLLHEVDIPAARPRTWDGDREDDAGLMILVGTALILFWSLRRWALRPLPAPAAPRARRSRFTPSRTREVGLSG